MSDFCNQCAADLGFPTGDFLSDREKIKPGMGYPELCEGCGMTFVDEEGNCVDPLCLKKHGLNHNSIEGSITAAEVCPSCGKEPISSVGLMQGGINCICSCGTKFHICAF